MWKASREISGLAEQDCSSAGSSAGANGSKASVLRGKGGHAMRTWRRLQPKSKVCKRTTFC